MQSASRSPSSQTAIPWYWRVIVVGLIVLALAGTTWWFVKHRGKLASVKPVFLAFLYISGTMTSYFVMSPYRAAAACSPLPSENGLVTTNVAVPSAGTYRVWARVRTSVATNNSFYLQLGDTLCNISMGGANLAINQWVWVGYQSGNTASTVTATLDATTYPLYLAGQDDNVQVDRILFTQDTACTPTGAGDNCSGATVYIDEDINQDTHVNLLDFSILSANYNKSGGAITNSRADIDGSGTVNLADFSRLSTKYGTQ